MKIPYLFRCEFVQFDDTRLSSKKWWDGFPYLGLAAGLDDRIAGVVPGHAPPFVSAQDSRAFRQDFVEGAEAFLGSVG